MYVADFHEKFVILYLFLLLLLFLKITRLKYVLHGQFQRKMTEIILEKHRKNDK